MTPAEWLELKEILGEALELPPADREGFLERACGGDADLKRRIEALIQADERDWKLLESPAAAALSAASELRLPGSGDRIGAYEILREIDRGGMGVVYLARRADAQFDKTVAIKLSRFEAGEALDLPMHKRFRAERQIVATLEHPNVARLLDGGATADGRPYFVMEYVEGEPLLAWCAARAKTLRERVELFLDVCSAVEAAHERGVVHRDLKPTNILVTNDGVVKLLDFGIAKLLAPQELGVSMEDTGVATGLMTPEYASPEQLRGEAVTAASDVFALGVVLYELVAGRRPHAVSPSSPAALVRAICEIEAPRASTVAPPDAGKVLSGDLDTVLSKALRKEPERRYPTAGELRDDLRRFLDGRPVQARPDTWGYRTRRFAGRHRGVLAVAGVAALAGAALSVVWIPGRGTGRVGSPATASSDSRSPTQTLVVLPFRDLSGSRVDPVLQLGMADTLITKLSTVPGISVRPTAAVSGFTDGSGDPVQTGRALRADAVVVGGLQQSQGRSRVTVRLVRVADGGTIWGDVFDSGVGDVFVVEDAIARRVAEALVPHLTPDARARLARRGTRSLDAYQEYLKGRYFWGRRTESDFRKAIFHFERAIAVDDRYALAHAGLADCWSLLGVWGAGPAGETLGRARAAADRAVTLDDAPGEAHASSAFVKWIYDWDWAGAEQAFRRAIAFSPSYATAHQWYAYFLCSRGRYDEAIAEIRRAQELDPLSVSIATDVGEIHGWAGRNDDAVVHLRSALDLEPNFPLAHNVLGTVYLAQNRPAEGLAELERAAELDASPRMVSTLGYGYGFAGRREDARRAEGRLTALAKERYVSPFAFALVLTGLGEDGRAIEMLERAYRERSDTMAVVAVHPLLRRLRGDSRFAALIARVDASPYRGE